MEYVIAIATYDRSKMFETHTYQLLVKHGITAKATLFLQSEDDAIAYEHFGLNTVRSPKGLVPTNNFIACYYVKGVWDAATVNSF